MKKIFTSILIVIFLFGMGALAYAGTNTGNTTTDKKAARQQTMVARKAFKAEIQPLIDQVKTNRTKIQQLRTEARDARKNAMQHIKDLKTKSDQLTDAQIAELKQTKETLKQAKLDLANTNGEVQTDMQAVKEARKTQDIDQAKAALNKIISIQQNRMTLIQNSIDEMNHILAI